jgi:hypothetical protein
MGNNKATEAADLTSAEEFVVVDEYARNHNPEDMIRYQGQWVAWSRDGRRVLFASRDPDKLCEMVDAAGLQPDDYVFAGIPIDGHVHVGDYLSLNRDTES